MSKPFFRVSAFAPPAGRCCDDCGGIISQAVGEHYYNPNPRAKIRKICPHCFDRRESSKAEHIAKWKDRQGISQAESHMASIRGE